MYHLHMNEISVGRKCDADIMHDGMLLLASRYPVIDSYSEAFVATCILHTNRAFALHSTVAVKSHSCSNKNLKCVHCTDTCKMASTNV